MTTVLLRLLMIKMLKDQAKKAALKRAHDAQRLSDEELASWVA